MSPNRCLIVEPKSLPFEDFDAAGLLTTAHLNYLGSPWDRRTGVYHPSSIHQCRRRLYYDRIGTPPKRSYGLKNLSIFELGHAIHARVQMRYKEVYPDAEIEKHVESEALHMAGSIDVFFPHHDWLMDIKTMGTTSFAGLVGPHSEHLDQLHCYMWMAGVPRAQILYIDRDKGFLRMFRTYFTMGRWQLICERITYVEEHIKMGREPEQEGTSYECSQCNFKYVCKPGLGASS